MTRKTTLTLIAAVIASGFAFGTSAEEIRPPGAASHEIVHNAKNKETRAPGMTKEIAPDAKETATGGPAGGLPTNH